jgi:SAM-dependent methyltransferase
MAVSETEAYIVERYAGVWQQWTQPGYQYKHAKGERVVNILRETGGLNGLVLELGVGPGGIARTVSRQGAHVVGIDLSPEALSRAKEHCRADAVTLMRASGFSLPFRNGSLPLVYASQVVHLFDAPGRLALMREVHRLLRSGGRFVFDMKNASSHLLRVARYSRERRRRNFPAQREILSLLREAGFSDVARRPGLLPVFWGARVPNNAILRALAHTTFFIATR